MGGGVSGDNQSLCYPLGCQWLFLVELSWFWSFLQVLLFAVSEVIKSDIL